MIKGLPYFNNLIFVQYNEKSQKLLDLTKNKKWTNF